LGSTYGKDDFGRCRLLFFYHGVGINGCVTELVSFDSLIKSLSNLAVSVADAVGFGISYYGTPVSDLG
jgi:peroxiredoxin